MNKKEAESLYPLVNSSLWKAFVDYKQVELDRLHKELEWQEDKAVTKTQGQIVEIRRDIGLQQRVNDMLNGN